MTLVTVLHPGEMGAAVAAQLRSAGLEVAWVRDGRSSASAARAADAGLTELESLGAAIAQSGIVLSICPPAFAEVVAGDVARSGFGGVYIEANAIAPARSRRIAAALAQAGARVVDGGIIGPPPRRGGTTRLYLSGPADAAGAAAVLFAPTAIEAVIVSDAVGDASGLKLAYASYQKASRALAAVSHALARAYGVHEHLDREAKLLDSRPLADTAQLSIVARRAWRWAPEMLEAAATLRDAGLPDDFAAAAAAVLARWCDAKDRDDLPLDLVLAALGPDAGER